MFRKVLFWSHLVAGVACGLVILMMSVTGVLLTYEHQLIARAEQPMRHVPAAADPAPLPLEDLLRQFAGNDPAVAPIEVFLASDPRAPMVVWAGDESHYVDRYNGTILTDSAAGVRSFFDTIVGWHRWFDADESGRELARAVTGASNLAFLFLLLSGIYLWLPPVFRRTAFRVRVFFNPRTDNAKARDYNWHHVFGFWSVLPLIVIVASALVFSYGWANDLLYRAVGDTPPAERRPPPMSEMEVGPDTPSIETTGLDAYVQAAAIAAPGWTSLTFVLPGPGARQVDVTVDYGTGRQPQKRETLRLDIATAAIAAREPFASLPAGRKARSWVRFLHTGEALGLLGQTVAGLVSLTSVLMVWTGLALAWRRLVSPVLRRRRLAAGST
jgi:uncharacterized iron-regulated membrane protein